MKALYTNIKERRKMLKMSQTDLAIGSGYTDKSMISKIERGEIDLPLSKVFTIAQVLDTDLITLMGLSEEPMLRYTADETNLIGSYRELNEEGKSILMSNVNFLNAQPQYKKFSLNQVVERNA